MVENEREAGKSGLGVERVNDCERKPYSSVISMLLSYRAPSRRAKARSSDGEEGKKREQFDSALALLHFVALEHVSYLAMPSHPPGCSCGDEDAHVLLEGTQDFLYSRVDRDKVVALNSEGEGKIVIRPWDEREQEDEVRFSWYSYSLRAVADVELRLFLGFLRTSSGSRAMPTTS